MKCGSVCVCERERERDKGGEERMKWEMYIACSHMDNATFILSWNSTVEVEASIIRKTFTY